MAAERYAKEKISEPKLHADGSMRPNVDTGLLRNSITFALTGEAPNISSYTDDHGNAGTPYSGTAPRGSYTGVFIGSNVEYAGDIENGSRTSRAYPFLRPAVSEHGDEYRKLIKGSLENA